ncbi:Polyamine N-acetyltransferase 1 [Orobanche hederae]
MDQPPPNENRVGKSSSSSKSKNTSARGTPKDTVSSSSNAPESTISQQQQQQLAPPLRRSARTNKFSGCYASKQTNKRERETKSNSQMDQLPLNKKCVGQVSSSSESKNTSRIGTPPEGTNMLRRNTSTISQQQEQLAPRRSARVNKFSNRYGYISPRIPVDPEMMRIWFKPEITSDSSQEKKIKLRRVFSPNSGFSARSIAEYERRRNAPPRAPVDLGTIVQRIRQLESKMFRKCYTYGPNIDQRTCIWSAGGRYSWSDLSSGITWVAVHGVDQICVVIRKIPPDPARMDDSLKRALHVNKEFTVLIQFLKTVVADMGDTTSVFRQRIDQSSKTSPFAVVSVVRGTDHHGSNSEALTAASGEERSIELLVEKLKSGTTLSSNHTVQTALSAMQYLFCQKFKSDEIVVCHLRTRNGDFRTLADEEVAEHLADIGF